MGGSDKSGKITSLLLYGSICRRKKRGKVDRLLRRNGLSIEWEEETVDSWTTRRIHKTLGALSETITPYSAVYSVWEGSSHGVV